MLALAGIFFISSPYWGHFLVNEKTGLTCFALSLTVSTPTGVNPLSDTYLLKFRVAKQITRKARN